MKDGHRQHQVTCTVGSVHRPTPSAAHHHYVTGVKGASQKSLAMDNACQSNKPGFAMFSKEGQHSLASLLTDHQPLMVHSDTSTSVNTSTSLSPLISTSRARPPFSDKYGRCLEILHYGTSSTVRLHQMKPSIYSPKSKQLLAIKIYRQDILDTQKNPRARTSICSAGSIAELHPHHPNILPITDILYNERSELCVVTPYCAGGDLHELISRTGPLPTAEADCIVAQVLRALEFLHKQNTAHRDLRLESVLLTGNGAIKLAGFGDGHIRRIWAKCAIPSEPDEESPHSDSPSQHSWSFSFPGILSSFSRLNSSTRHKVDGAHSTVSLPGMSLPYAPPEVFYSQSRRRSRQDDLYIHENEEEEEEEEDRDPRPADVWATAIIYMTLLMGRLPWRSARPQREDTRYLEYLRCRQEQDGYPPIEALGMVSLQVPLSFSVLLPASIHRLFFCFSFISFPSRKTR
ncbi:hypothetical protein N7462_006181 [Penicillium macrosclerotiorum]|uniref:uncharacterized protein n=1 Tax=Penicillium macrosclerotiorum TaxID=303699 RepID=UPI0025470261|nr:uncharacterized protein N7462_006181 [Penicillium macrosclerotiorum]KAJ5683016.1 hypothetical protein N7462_006181 [Penicillium macrosclerotiorum]